MKMFNRQTKSQVSSLLMAIVFVAVLAVPNILLAAAAGGFAGADERVCGFFENISGLLNMASIAVVTIAVIFCGYQIAFANKRISDCMPILVGGLLIGAAGQIARMLLAGNGSTTECTAMLINVLPILNA